MQLQLQKIVHGHETQDGAGVHIKRSLGQNPNLRFDPFLMLDEFGSTGAEDYIGGFPSHPHRGFETVTYMLEGHMLHEDHIGNQGHLRDGDVQWMTAGRGIIHSEMPQQEHGTMRGFQLWLNLPAAEKMKEASYRDIPAIDIPITNLLQGGTIKVIANSAFIAGQTIRGPIQGLTTEPIYWDIHLPAHTEFHHAMPEDHNTLVYVYEGALTIGEDRPKLTKGNAGLLSHGDQLSVQALTEGARFLVISGKPLNEPVVQYGPFVMNTNAEIEQAIRDFRSGNFAN